MWYVYIIKSKEQLIYTGLTKNLSRRLTEHNLHQSKWTKRGTNWKIIHAEKYNSIQKARIREKYFKNNAGKEWLKRRGII